MNTVFDNTHNRLNTSSVKWDFMHEKLGIDGDDLLPMWVSDYDFKTPENVIAALKQRVEHGIFGYSERNEDYFNALTDWYARRHDVQIERSTVATIHGVLPGIALALQIITQAGDGIIVQTPGYGAFTNIIKLNDRRVIENPLIDTQDGYQIDFSDLEHSLAKGAKAVLLCNPHNPIGKIWTYHEIEKIAELCERYQAWLISDEIWGDLTLPSHQYCSALRLPPQFHQRLIVATAASKTFGLSSLRISNFVIPNTEIHRLFVRKMSSLGLDVYNVLAMCAATEAYKNGDGWLDDLMAYTQGNINYLSNFLAQSLPHITFHRPTAGYLVWLNCQSLNIDDNELSKRCIAAGIVPSMGDTFGQGGAGFIRLNLGCPKQTLEKACSRLVAALQK